jgi:hypothetical protein
MPLFGRPERVPAAVRDRLPATERIVSWADTVDGEVILASPSGLWWPGPGEPRLIGWHQINKVIWRDNALSVVEADVLDDLLLVDRPPVRAGISVPRDLPPTVRKRVEDNVVRSQVLPVAGGAALFVGRHVPGRDGLSWWARLEAGTADTDQVRAAISAQLALMRAEWEAENLPD